MAVERKWLAVPAVNLTADGTQFGIVTVSNTAGFKVKGSAVLSANTKPILQVQIQRVLSSTRMIVGTPGTTPSPNNFINVSAYTVALNAQIAFPEQDKNRIKADDIDQAVYESDPTVAKRNVLVDQYGDFYDTVIDAHGIHRLAVDAEITVESIEIGTVNQGNPNTLDKAWPVKISDGVEQAEITSLNDLQVADVPNQQGVTVVLSLTTTPQEGKTGGTALPNRKYIEMEALTKNVKWGYTPAALVFDLFKRQFIALPIGENCKIYYAASVGTAQVAFSEK